MQHRAPQESRAFHALLLGVAIPVLAAPIGWLVAVWARRRARLTGHHLWARRIAGLALVDTLVALAVLGLALAPGEATAPLTEGRPAPRGFLGVTVEGPAEGGGVRIMPLAGMPAEAAGLREGDVVVAIDGAPIDSAEALRAAVNEDPFSARRVRVRRGDATFERSIEPVRGAPRGPVVGAEGLFVPLHERTAAECLAAERPRVGWPQLVLYGLVAALGLGLFLATRRRGGADGLLWLLGAALLLAVAGVGLLARYGTCRAVAGATIGGALVALVAQAAALVLGGWALRRRVPTAGPLLAPLPPFRAYARALFYAFAWVPRTGLLAWALAGAAAALAPGWLGDLGWLQTGTALDAFAGAELGAGGAALLLIGGALLGPIGEELVFRGALLPHLARTFSPWAAIVASGVVFGFLHVHHGASIAGPLTLGVILGWAWARTGDLRVPIALHCTFNAGALVTTVLLA